MSDATFLFLAGVVLVVLVVLAWSPGERNPHVNAPRKWWTRNPK
jgi:hypothetical protein